MKNANVTINILVEAFKPSADDAEKLHLSVSQ